MMKNLFAIVVLLFALTGCSTANLRVADQLSSVKRGVVTDIKEVTLAGTNSGLGGASGATAGAVIGARSGMGGSFTRQIFSMLVGEIAGGIAGSAAERKLTETAGLELTVKLDDGSEIALPVRRDAAEGIAIGDRVRIVQNGARAAVEKEKV